MKVVVPTRGDGFIVHMQGATVAFFRCGECLAETFLSTPSGSG